MIPIAQPLIGEEEKEAVLAVLDSGLIAQGPKVQQFEEEFAAWCGTKYAVAVSSGTAALHLALLAHGIGEDDEVITSSFSFMASASTIVMTGAKPRFADIEPAYFTIDPVEILDQLTPSVRAIIPVHLFGQQCDMEAINAIAEAHGLIVIEDACQAHGAKLYGRKVGTNNTACYSFYPTKNMTTGEGGMITTNDAAIADRLRLLRNHGMRQRYHHEIIGYNLRMMDMQAAIGIVQLAKLEQWNRQRQANAAFLTKHLQGIPGLITPKTRPGAEHVFHQYTIRVKNRDAVVQQLQQAGIGVGIYYPIPIHRQTPFVEPTPNKSSVKSSVNASNKASLYVTDECSEEVLSLPVHPGLTQAQLETVAQSVAEAVQNTQSTPSSKQ